MTKNSERFLSIGLMSGTSMDGIDAALVETDGQNYCRFIDHFFHPYTESFHNLLKKTEKYIAQANGAFTENQIIEKDLNIRNVIDQSTDAHIKAIESIIKNNISLENEDFMIGYHGQTFFHQPQNKRSVILGFPDKIAQKFKCKVVFDFRSNDIFNNGQGAPLAPIYHHFLAKKNNLYPAVFINCGGISNISVISGSNENEGLEAFDTGPGNVLLDKFIKLKTNNQYTFDKDGQFGLKGKYHFNLLNILKEKACSKEKYFSSPTPKSLDIFDFTLPQEILKLNIEDGAKTLAFFTAQCIVFGIKQTNKTPLNCFISGGGFKNPNIIEGLKFFFKEENFHAFDIQYTDDIGYPSQSLEAQLFAYLAVRSLKKLPLSFPKTTGIHQPLSGGVIYT